jgi:biopolymer transport protein ExbD
MIARPFTRPFSFSGLMQPPRQRWYFIGWLNVALLVALMSVVGSRLVLAPGVEVALPGGSAGDRISVGSSLVVTVTRNEVVFFAGRRMGLPEFESALAREVAGRDNVVLLVRADRELPLDALLRLTESARRGGVQRVQIASRRGSSGAVDIREVR